MMAADPAAGRVSRRPLFAARALIHQDDVVSGPHGALDEDGAIGRKKEAAARGCGLNRRLLCLVRLPVIVGHSAVALPTVGCRFAAVLTEHTLLPW